MRVKRVIGLIPLVDDARKSLWMLPGYMDGVAAAGGLPVMLPLTGDGTDIDRLCDLCDGFLLTGGHDVSPEYYGQARLPVCGATSPARDRMEDGVLRRAMAMDKPVLGICRGLQFINAALGGTLWQDLPTQRPSDVVHERRPPESIATHDVDVISGTPLAELTHADALRVNSYHHQAVRGLAAPLRTMATARDGLVEAAWHPGQRFLWAVQWHPEFSWQTDPASLAIFRAFVAACG